MKVFELAKELDMGAIELVEKLKSSGMSVRNHMVALSDDELEKARELFNADYVIWVDTIKEGRYDDTNKMFVKPKKFNFQVTSKEAEHWANKIAEQLISKKED